MCYYLYFDYSIFVIKIEVRERKKNRAGSLNFGEFVTYVPQKKLTLDCFLFFVQEFGQCLTVSAALFTAFSTCVLLS